MEMTEIAKSLSVVYQPHPVATLQGRQSILMAVEEGSSVRDVLLAAGVDPYQPITITLDDRLLTVEEWDLICPKTGQIINVQATVQGGGGNSNPMQVVLMIAVVALAAIAAPYLAAAIPGMVGATGALTSVGLGVAAGIGAAISIGGSLLIGALFPPKTATDAVGQNPEVSPTYSLAGGSNQARPYQSMPVVMGTHRLFFDLASRPYTEYRGEDQYLYQIFNNSLGTVWADDFRIGTTPLLSYAGVEIFASDANGKLPQFPGNVDVSAGSALPWSWDWVNRTTSTNTYRIGVDVEAIVFRIDDKGRFREATLEFYLEYAVAGSGNWQPAPFSNAYFASLSSPSPGVFVITGSSSKPQRGTIYIDVPVGQYDVRIRRSQPESTDTKVTLQLGFNGVKSYQEDTANYRGQNRIGLIIKASAQLNGVVQQLSATVAASATYWSGSAWVTGQTSNPAHWFAHFAKGVYNSDGKLMYGVGLSDAQLDLGSLAVWANFCATENLTFNAVLDGSQTAADVLNMIAKAGLGSPTWASGKLGVVFDARDASPVAAFGMSNIIRNSFEVAYLTEQLADEIIVRFRNPDKDWEQDEVRAVAPDVTTPTRTSSIELFGCTNATMAGKFANYVAAQQYYRKRRISWQTDFEGFVCQRGDVVLLSHDLTQWGYSGRFVSINGLTVTLDRKVPRNGSVEYLMLIRPDGTTSTYNVNAASGDSDTITLANFPSLQAGADLIDHRWCFSPLATPGKKVKIISVAPASDSRIQIVATDEYPEFYNAWGGTFIPPQDQTVLPAQPVTITNLTATSRVAFVNGYLTNRVGVSWNVGGGTLYTRIRIYLDGSLVREVAQNLTGYEEIDIAGAGLFYVEATPFGITGAGITQTTALTLVDVDFPPPPTSVTLVSGQNAKSATYIWTEVLGVQSYVISIVVGGVEKRRVNVGNTLSYTYTLDQAIADGGPYREYEFRVYSVNQTGQSLTYVAATFSNPQIGALVNASVEAMPNSFWFQCDLPTDPDFAAIRVWISKTNNFTPADSDIAYDGSDNWITISADNVGNPLESGVMYYIRAAAYDTFGDDNLTLTGQFSTTILSPAWGILEGEIQEVLLESGLRDRIDLIDADATVPGSVNNRILDEAEDRAAAILAEETARIAADAAEVIARNDAILVETNAREEAISIESHQRLIQVQSAAEASLNALIAAENERTDRLVDTAAARQELSTDLQVGLAAEAAARLSLTTVVNQNTADITAEQLARSTADSALASDITTLFTQVDDNAAAISSEATARATADSAEATERSNLATQMRGSYTGNDLTALTTGLLYQERIARSTQDTALAQQITLLSAGAGEQFDWKEIWYFDDGIEGWTGNGTPTASGGFLRPANQASGAYVASPTGLAVDAEKYRQVRLRIRKGGTPTFAGYIWWNGAGQSWDTSRRLTLDTPSFDTNGISLIVANLEWTGTIDQIRVDLSSAQTATDYFEIDWVATGRPSPGASSAQLLDEQIARAAADAAEVTARETLSTSIIGTTNPTGVTLGGLTAGLIYDERTARTTQDTALATSISTLQATVTSNYTTLDAAITDEATARANADSAEVTARQALSTTLTGFTDPTGKTLADLASGLVFDEKSARVTADSALSTSISGLSSDLGDLSADLTTVQTTLVELDSAVAEQSTTLIATDRKLTTFTDQNAEAILRDAIAVNQERITREQTIAVASFDLATKIDAGLLAESTARLALAAVVDNNTALIVSEQTARATADEAIASDVLTLTAQVDENEATLTQEAITRADADSALSTSITNLTAVVNSNTAAIQSEAITRADADSAEATARLALAARVTDTETGLVAANAAITTEQTVRATADSALATSIEELSVVVDDNIAAIQTEATARADADSALSSSITTLQTTVNGNTTSIQTNATSINGINAKYTVKIDNNGYVTGYGLISTANNGVPTSDFAVVADRFSISPTGSAFNANPASPFFVLTSTTTVNGISLPAGTYIKQAFIHNAAITTAKIQDAAITTAKIADATIGSAQIANTIQSTNYSATTGWQINKSGVMYLNEANVRGEINVGAYTGGYNWPASGNGVHISKFGILAGNYNTGKYFQLYTPDDGGQAAIYTNIPAYIESGQITDAMIANGTITNAKIATLDAGKINTGTLSADRIGVGTLDAKIANISAAVITSGTIASARIGDATITSAKIGTAEVGTLKIAGNAVTNTAAFYSSTNGGTFYISSNVSSYLKIIARTDYGGQSYNNLKVYVNGGLILDFTGDTVYNGLFGSDVWLSKIDISVIVVDAGTHTITMYNQGNIYGRVPYLIVANIFQR